MNKLEHIISQIIQDQGPVDVATFMGYALHHQKYGYYCTQNPIGSAGDFITAPEISQMFGEVIGAYLCDIWMQMDRPVPFALVEFGPGRGVLMDDILRVTRSFPGFHDAISLHLVEIHPEFRKWQRQRLSKYIPEHRIYHHADMSELPGDMPLICVANEFLDALPVRQFCYRDAQWYERVVAMGPDKQGCVWDVSEVMLDKLPTATAKVMKAKEKNARDGDIIEISQAQADWCLSLLDRMKRQGGFCLIFDYGYDKLACGDTLQAVRHHQYVDVFSDIGLCDLTTLVDFYTLGQLIQQNEGVVFGPRAQGNFLKDVGIEHRAISLMKQATQSQKKDIESALHRLTHPVEMGESFKIMAFTVTGKTNSASTLQPIGL